MKLLQSLLIAAGGFAVVAALPFALERQGAHSGSEGASAGSGDAPAPRQYEAALPEVAAAIVPETAEPTARMERVPYVAAGLPAPEMARAAVRAQALGRSAPAASEAPAAPVALPYRADVEQAQRILDAWGAVGVRADGKLGPMTKAALTKFQQSSGVRATGDLDPETMAALRTWQRERSEAAVAAAAPAAPAAEAPAPAPAVAFVAALTSDELERERADRDPKAVPTLQTVSDVKRLQRKLASLGLYEGEIDGKWGQNTRASVQSYRRSKGLSDSGRVDADLWKYLVAEAAEREQEREVQMARNARLPEPAGRTTIPPGRVAGVQEEAAPVVEVESAPAPAIEPQAAAKPAAPPARLYALEPAAVKAAPAAKHEVVVEVKQEPKPAIKAPASPAPRNVAAPIAPPPAGDVGDLAPAGVAHMARLTEVVSGLERLVGSAESAAAQKLKESEKAPKVVASARTFTASRTQESAAPVPSLAALQASAAALSEPAATTEPAAEPKPVQAPKPVPAPRMTQTTGELPRTATPPPGAEAVPTAAPAVPAGKVTVTPGTQASDLPDRIIPVTRELSAVIAPVTAPPLPDPPRAQEVLSVAPPSEHEQAHALCTEIDELHSRLTQRYKEEIAKEPLAETFAKVEKGREAMKSDLAAGKLTTILERGPGFRKAIEMLLNDAAKGRLDSMMGQKSITSQLDKSVLDEIGKLRGEGRHSDAADVLIGSVKIPEPRTPARTTARATSTRRR